MPGRGQPLPHPADVGAVSTERRNTSLIVGGRVVLDASCQEGARSAPAVGQAPAVHGAARPRVERPSAGVWAVTGRGITPNNEKLR